MLLVCTPMYGYLVSLFALAIYDGYHVNTVFITFYIAITWSYDLVDVYLINSPESRSPIPRFCVTVLQ